MGRIIWNPEWNTGSPHIDEQHPDLKKHKAFHDSLRKRVQSLEEDFRKDPKDVEAKVIALVQDRMDNHIGVEDKMLAKYLLQRASQASNLKS